MSRKQGPRSAGMRPAANAAQLPTRGDEKHMTFEEATA